MAVHEGMCVYGVYMGIHECTSMHVSICEYIMSWMYIPDGYTWVKKELFSLCSHCNYSTNYSLALPDHPHAGAYNL